MSSFDHSSLQTRENFGPVLPILEVDDVDHAIRIVSERYVISRFLLPMTTYVSE